MSDSPDQLPIDVLTFGKSARRRHGDGPLSGEGGGGGDVDSGMGISHMLLGSVCVYVTVLHVLDLFNVY